jgi:hypothetical protein
MTDATARRELRKAKEGGFCGFCFVRSRPLKHKSSCKLVVEHGNRIGLGPSSIIAD